MKAFNPEKELKKIQHGNRNKVIFGVLALLIIIGISSSYALYQVRYSKRIIYTKVAPFSNHDIDLAVYIDGSPSSNGDFPEKDEGKIYEKIDCGKTNVKAYWDYDKWALVLETNKKAKCTVYFKTGSSSSGEKLDTSGANPPELYQGLIPIKYDDDGTIRVADPKSNDWYNYDEKKWANAVLIDSSDKTIVRDFSSSGNYATIVGGAQINEEGLELDGVDDGIYLGSMVKDLFQHSNTIQIRLKRTEANRKVVLMGNFNGSNSHIQYEIESSNIFYIYGQGSSPHGGTFNINDKFVTITYVYDRQEGNIKIYIDDKLEYTAVDNVYKTLNLDFSGAYIGRSQSQIGTGGCAFKGTIEKIMIYNKALTEQEINQNLQSESGKVGNSGIVEDNLHLYYDFKVDQKVDTTPGKVLNMNAISQMYVWIPRYKYQLFNVYNGTVSEQMINIKFENGTESTGDVSCSINDKGEEICSNAINGNWYTHPAFKFGDTNLTGIWVGKFESSNTLTDIKILPNMNAIMNQSVSAIFEAVRNIESAINIDDTNINKYNLKKEQIDTHLMKNMEWGAVAYLSQSKYGRCEASGSCSEIVINSKTGFITGYDNAGNVWNTTNGIHASTTDNIYGIYDTRGGSCEYVMGIMVDNLGSPALGNSGFLKDNFPNKKYYDLYSYGVSTAEYKRGHLGDAVRETHGWYGNFELFITSSASYFIRSGRENDGSYAGNFYYYNHDGGGQGMDSFRVALTQQDGNE